ncbi:WxL domain-containing protein [Enterococcus avium]|uniref:WxL domain-containing protein n=1 Tax=Enterococcus avium TaxID=33945 RepID=UPI0034D1EA1A
MNKKIRLLLCINFLFAQLTPMTVTAEDVDETDSITKTESTISSKEGETSITSSMPEIPSTKSKETIDSEDSNKTASSSEDNSQKNSITPTGGGAVPLGATLIEGVDIDADFALLLRTDSGVTNSGFSGYGKAQDQLTVSDMETITRIDVRYMNLNSLLGIEYAINLGDLDCSYNTITELDLSNNNLLEMLTCYGIGVSELDVSNKPDLFNIQCGGARMTVLNASNNPSLRQLMCEASQLTELNVGNNPLLYLLSCNNGQLRELDLSGCPALTTLSCSSNKLTELDVSSLPILESLSCSFNSLTELDVSSLSTLKGLNCDYNNLTELDVSSSSSLETLSCSNNQISELDVSSLLSLTTLNCDNNQLSELDVSSLLSLTTLNCDNNQLSELDVSSLLSLTTLNCNSNQLSELDVSNCSKLISLYCSHNMIFDITSAYGLNDLTILYATQQEINMDIPTINNGNFTIDLLKTTAEAGLQLSSTIPGSPILTAVGDRIDVSNVTVASFTGRPFISFSYPSSALAEGNLSSSQKYFSGEIYFNRVSYLETSLIPEKTKTASNKKVSWTWNMRNTSDVSSEHIKARLSLPNELTIDPTSILINGNPGTLADIDGTNDLGTLNRYETIEITFETTVSGTAGSWLEATGELTWTDSNSRSNEATGSVQIKDDEQTFTPKESNDMALLSTPESFRFGIWDVKNTAQKVNLLSSNYLTNTQVVSDGFYTRLRDDRTTSTGWKLSAELSEFRGSSNELMPNSSGVFLRMEDLTIENIIDKDTPSEAINPSPVGAPSTVVTDETLVAGQTAKTLVSANPGEGMETWQLRIPFDKVSLNLPANAGQKSKNYSATLTWSLDDTP